MVLYGEREGFKSKYGCVGQDTHERAWSNV